MRITTYYDREGDILYLDFAKSKKISTGIQLTDELVLRLDPDTHRPTKLVIHNYTKLVAESLNGHVDFIVDTTAIPVHLYPTVIRALKTAPLNQFLTLRRPVRAKAPRVFLSENLLPRVALKTA